ncbi:phosphatidylinositol kinase [Achlya hypogyna]|uniref:Phosphatidylinositol kinase n=1 Tax=Achlya hypogyna TaxID=1202772 RepID=A0A1V9YAS0_ACHHY|nr:phosphatidylinositol kinase [Achlya hypogyna]
MPMFPTRYFSASTTSDQSWLQSLKGGLAKKAPSKKTLALPFVISKQLVAKRWGRAPPTVPEPVSPIVQDPPGMEAAMDLRRRALQAAISSGDLVLTKDGCGGAYLLSEDDTPVAIFKPRDEEFMAPNNPRGYVCHSAIVGETAHPTRKGFRVGNGAMREVAAFMLDAAYDGFSGVPATSFVTAPVADKWKEGSVQAFVPSDASAEDMGTLQFSVHDVHKIAILDLRLFNTDRHAGNILLQATHDKTTKYNMVPIDHGLTLPAYQYLDGATFDWLHWPQAKFPLSAAAIAHVERLDIAADAQVLRTVGLPEDCVITMQIATTLLKKAVAAGYSLYDIGVLVQREGLGDTPSQLEDVVEQARAMLPTGYDPRVAGPMLLGLVDKALTSLLLDYPKSKVRSISNL